MPRPLVPTPRRPGPTKNKDPLIEAVHQKAEAQKKKVEEMSWTPQRGSQFAFHASPVDELLYGGAAGGGKSDSLLVEALRYTHEKDYRAIIFRRTYPEIEQSLVPRAYELFHGRAAAKVRGTQWVFPSGAVINLSHMQREEDKEKHKSSQYDYIGFDELTSFTETQYTYMFSRMRGKNPRIKRVMRAATNPTGIGHGWVKSRFIEMNNEPMDFEGTVDFEFAVGWRAKSSHGDYRVYSNFSDLPPNFHKGAPEFSNEEYKVYKSRSSGLTRAFIPALLWGNSKLLSGDPDYAKRLRELSPKQQAALLYGSWDIFEGQFFSEWDPEIHVTESFSPPESWRRFCSIDYGYAAPFSCLWFALDEDGKVFVYRELYAKKLTTSDQAKAILAATGEEKIEWFTCDPAMFTRQGTGESHADVYARHGIFLSPSSNKRVPGWALMHEYLSKGNLVFFPNCQNCIRTIPAQMHAKGNPEDLNTDGEDHACDCIRYFLLTLKGWRTNVAELDEQYPEWWKEIRKKKKEIVKRVRL